MTSHDLTGCTWTLTAIGAEAADEAAAELQLGEDGRLSGTGGVNRLMGAFVATADEISFADIATTRRAGPPAAMDQEGALLEVLDGTQQWSIEGDRLRIGPATFIATTSGRSGPGVAGAR